MHRFDSSLIPHLERAVEQIEALRQGTEKPMWTMPDFAPENANASLWHIERDGNRMAHTLIRTLAMMRMDMALAAWCPDEGSATMKALYDENAARYRGMVAILEAQYGEDEVAAFLAVISRQMDAHDALT